MTKELVISSNRHETRVAILEDDQVVEVYHQRENEYSLAGSIHKGRVTRVLPGMQSAFVDIGLDRDAFLYVSDFFEDNEEYDKIVTSVEDTVLKLDRGPQQEPAAAAPTAVAPPTPAATPVEPEPRPTPADREPGEDTLVSAAAAGVQAPPAGYEQRGDRDRDRRGRRGRRRRGQKGGGRGLPDSKFYSPAHGPEPLAERTVPAPEVAEPVVEEEPSPRASVAEDFLVLPGESLAKYTAPSDEGGDEEDTSVPDMDATTDEDAGPEAEQAESAAPTVADETPAEPAAAESVTTSEVAVQPPAEPQPELAQAVEEAAEAEADECVEAPPVEETEAEAEPEAVETADVEAAPEPAEEAGLPTEAAPESSSESPMDVDGEGASEVETPATEEGPEPARIPTSLTATLREQGPRYLHRVSRRMRRRGGRDSRHGSPAEVGVPAGNSVAEAPGSPEARPEPRIVTAPQPEAKPEKTGTPSISDLLKQGQEIIVQIAKEPLGQKGARITSHIALPGRFLVYMPTVDHIGVSRKIPSDDERLRLKRILQSNRTGIPGGFIVRTAGEGHSEEELRADMMFLYNLWLDMRQKAERRPAPVLIHHDLSVVERVLRDQLTSAFKSIWVDNEEAYENVLRFVQRFQPALVTRVKLYTRSNPVFDEFGITAELEKALRPKVWLKSGGHIVINQTEALVAIDVNTGKFVGKSNRLEDTIVKTNTDAIKEIVRQIRLRDLGGIIVVDFIDMDERKNRQKVMQSLEEAMRADKAPYKILQFNDFGLVAITRKRVKQSLERTLCSPCPYCEGSGYVKSPQTVVSEILQEAQKQAKAIEGKDVMLRVAPEVAKLLKSNQNTYLQEIEEILGRTVIVKSDPQLQQEKFDLA
jgi:ribonuclease G